MGDFLFDIGFGLFGEIFLSEIGEGWR